MQPETYYDTEERPPSDDDYTWAGGENGPSSNLRRHAPAAHRSTTLPSSSHVVSGANTPASSTAQGETAAILGQGPPLLVHAGGVHLQQA